MRFQKVDPSYVTIQINKLKWRTWMHLLKIRIPRTSAIWIFWSYFWNRTRGLHVPPDLNWCDFFNSLVLVRSKVSFFSVVPDRWVWDSYRKHKNVDNNDYPKTVKKSDNYNLIHNDDPKGYLMTVGVKLPTKIKIQESSISYKL